MKDFLANYDNNYKICFKFIKKQFSNAHFTDGDVEDVVSTGVFKILTRPNLLPNLATLLYVANLSAIDLYRKRCKETLVSDFHAHTNTSFWDNDDLETKNLIESVVAEVAQLNPRRRELMELKYHVCTFETAVSNDEIMAFKNQPRLNSKKMAVQLGYPSAIALRQETFRAVTQLKTRLAA
jgi:hypothetical protein